MKVKRQYYYIANENALESNYKRAGLPAEMLDWLEAENIRSVEDVKEDAEMYLSDRGQLHTNITEILDCFLTGTKSLYASLHIDRPKYTMMYRFDPYGVHTWYRYGIETVVMQIWFTRYRVSKWYVRDSYDLRDGQYHLGYEVIRSFDFFGRLTWDADNKRIDAVPLFITNMDLRR